MTVHPSAQPTRRDPLVGSVQSVRPACPNRARSTAACLPDSSPTAAHPSPFWPVDHQEHH